MANPYLAALIATWRREKKRAAGVSVPKSKPESDIWGSPLEPKASPPVAPERDGSSKS